MRCEKVGLRPLLLVALAVLASGAAPLLADIGSVVILGTNSVDLNQNAEVLSGDVVANQASEGPTLGCGGREMCVGVNVDTPGGYAVQGDSVQLKQNAVVGGDLYYNDLTGNGTVLGNLFTPVALPIYPALPTFVAEPPRPDAQDVFVPVHGSIELAAGDYGVIQVKNHGTVVFLGGVYNVRELDFGVKTEILFDAPTEIRVEGRLALDQNSYMGPAEGSGIDASHVVLYVAGINGNDGNLGSSPKAAKLGVKTEVFANVYAPNGSLEILQNASATGAFLARDVKLGVNATASLASSFGNQPPIADDQEALTNGAAPLQLTLTGSDPEGADLSFSITAEPTQGSVSDPTPVVPTSGVCSETVQTCSTDADCPVGETCVLPPITSATVVYTPDTGDDLEDSFQFRASDGFLESLDATVFINPNDVGVPPEPEQLAVFDTSAETPIDTPVTFPIEGEAPTADLPIVFSITQEPSNGSAGLMQDPEVTPTTALITYMPDAGFEGEDSISYEGCTVVECDSGTATVSVVDPNFVEPPPDTVTIDNETVETMPGESVAITLHTETSSTGGAIPGRRIVLSLGNPAIQQLDQSGAAVAGNVADADEDGFGDNHNDLPGPAPVLMAAGVGQEGGPGSNGTVYMQMEWDVSPFAGRDDDVVDAQVTLHTLKGSVDSAITGFWAGTAEQDGLLTDSDFEAPAVQTLASMEVPADPPGTEGTFEFDVTSELRNALLAGIDYFSVQGRALVPPGIGTVRGLQVRTTADGNLEGGLEPQLSLELIDSIQVLLYVTSLPEAGSLIDENGRPIPSSPNQFPPFLLSSNVLMYQAGSGFAGDSFGVAAELVVNDQLVSSATGLVTLQLASGIELGNVSVEVVGGGDVASNPARMLCPGRCISQFEIGKTIALTVRPLDANWEFSGWGGDCEGDSPITLVEVKQSTHCVAVFSRTKR